MNKKIQSKHVLLTIFLGMGLLTSIPTLAGVTCSNNPLTSTVTATIPTTPITTVGSPANRYLTDWFFGPASGYSSFYSGCSYNSTIASQARINLTSAGSDIDGYPIFKTNVPGVGIIFKGRDRANEPGKAIGSAWTDIISGSTTFWDGSFGARLVSTTETIVSGTVSGLGTVGQLHIVDKNDITGSSTITPINIMVNGSVVFTSKTCSVSTNSKNISVSLGTVNSNAISTTGSSLVNSAFTINLDSCSADLKVNMTFTDNNNPANTSNALSLTNDGQQATGVGIRIINQATMQPVNFGPDSAIVGNPNQFMVINTTGTNVAIPFSATYVKTGSSAIVGGTANGVATFTMSYQ
ncbi:fimbrial protein [Buttiauxella gaviniae]|uniref:fimbrial protein n=1 Tax=Buttiauxella gaviniae TaxID=82990 RepID=UPI003C77FB5F